MKFSLNSDPNAYDCFNCMHLSEDGTANLSSGHGQAVTLNVIADWKVDPVYEDSNETNSSNKKLIGGTLFFSNFRANPRNPFHRNENINFNDLEVEFRVEYTETMVVEGRVWYLKSAFEEIIHVYDRKYIFNFDPVSFCQCPGDKRDVNSLFKYPSLYEITFYDSYQSVKSSYGDWFAAGKSLDSPFTFSYDLARKGNDFYADPIEDWIKDIDPEHGDIVIGIINSITKDHAEKLEKRDYSTESSLIFLFTKTGQPVGFMFYIKYAEIYDFFKILCYKVKDGSEDNLETYFLKIRDSYMNTCIMPNDLISDQALTKAGYIICKDFNKFSAKAKAKFESLQIIPEMLWLSLDENDNED